MCAAGFNWITRLLACAPRNATRVWLEVAVVAAEMCAAAFNWITRLLACAPRMRREYGLR
ncbi:MAG: hypothetical protein AB7N24_19655 [Dehalococcoidia bacterium]